MCCVSGMAPEASRRSEPRNDCGVTVLRQTNVEAFWRLNGLQNVNVEKTHGWAAEPCLSRRRLGEGGSSLVRLHLKPASAFRLRRGSLCSPLRCERRLAGVAGLEPERIPSPIFAKTR